MKNRKLRIIFDAGPLVNGQKSGVGYYVYQLVSALAKNNPDDLELIGYYFNFLGRKKPDLPKYSNVSYKASVIIPGKTLSLTRRFGFQPPLELFIRSQADLVLFTNFVSLPTIRPSKKALIVYDLGFEDCPEYLQPSNLRFLKKFAPESIKKSNLIIVNSQFTKDSIIKHYKVSPAKIVVSPIPPPVPAGTKLTRPKNINQKYILFMSTLEPRKNYKNLATAYSLLHKNLKKEYQLVLAGGSGWNNQEDMSTIRQMHRKGENILVTGYVNEETKISLYQNASLLVMPSHYEGFGMPILEAMSYQVPVAVSSIPVFHEVAANAAVYFDKDNPKDMANKISQVLESKTKHDELLINSKKLLTRYDWSAVARQLMKSFRNFSEK